MKLFGNTSKIIDKEKNGESVPILEVAEVVLVQWNLIGLQYQQKSDVLYTFTLNSQFSDFRNV